MAHAEEKFASRVINDSESPTAETVWLLFDYADEVAAYAGLIAAPLPSTYTFPSGRVASLKSISIRDVSNNMWEANVSYDVHIPKVLDQVDYEFEAGSQQVTLTHALATTAYTGGGRTAPDFKQGINVSADGKIQGIAVDRPQFTFQLTKYWDPADVTAAYQLTVAGLVGKVNDATFPSGGLPAGSVKFLGARGRLAGNKFPITYRFEFSPNETGLTVADITGINRKGWQYLDIYRRTISDASAKKKVEVPHSVYVHTVYPEADFSALGL